LVLLGEPGIGKSSVIEEEFALALKGVVPGVRDVRKVDLRETGDQNSFFHEAFEHEDMKAWRSGSSMMTLFIDSLDEGLMAMDRVAPLLVKGLKSLPTERLSVRIACRTAEWPRSVEDALNGLWPKKGDIEFRELLPLSQAQVQAAATASGLDASLFMKMVSDLELQPLASKPITLELLLEAFFRGESLASTKPELYEQGCLILCEDQRWADGTKNAVLTAAQRLEVVSRIAAVLVFSKKAAVWTGLEKNFTTFRDSDVRESELIGGMEDDGTGPFRVELEHVQDALRTGLFTSRGLDRLGWAHKSYAEYLAARYIKKKGLSPIQVRSLVRSADDPEQKLIPQLHETVAWVVGDDPQLYQEVLATDPDVLLRSDVAIASPEQKAQLVTGLVRAFGSGALSYRTSGLFERFRRLAFPGIEDLLREFLGDGSLNDAAKDCAINIAHQCEVKAIAPEVCLIALDSVCGMHLRATAAQFVAVYGGTEERKGLMPLALGIEEDHSDQLKGYSLRALWPGHITAAELFDLLTEPKEPGLIGGYKVFMSYELVADLESEDMPVALGWLRANQGNGRMEDRFDELADGVMYKGWTLLDGAPWIDEYASTALLRMRVHDQVVGGVTHAKPFREELSSNPERRRALVRALLEQSDNEDVSRLAFSIRDMLLRDGDVFWMLDEVECASGSKANLWSRLILYTFQHDHTDEVVAILELAARNEHLYKQFENMIQPDDLDDPVVQDRREHELRWRRRRDQEMPLIHPSPAELMEAHLDRIETGDLDAWWQLVYHHLVLTPYGPQPPSFSVEADLAQYPGWINTDDRNRSRMMRAAKRFVEEFDPGTDKWLGLDVFYKPAIVGYRSLRLLQKLEPQVLDELGPDRWSAWTPIILENFITNEVDESNTSRALAEMAYAKAPQAALDIIPTLLRENDRRERYLTVLERLSGCWDTLLSEVVFPMLAERGLRDHTKAVIMDQLLKVGYQPALEMAHSMIGSGGDVSDDLQIETLVLLMEHIPDDQWFTVWEELMKHVDLAKAVLIHLCERNWRHQHRFVERLTEEQVLNLFMFLEQHWPRQEDPKQPSGVLVGVHPRMEVGEFRDSLLAHLRDRGTKAACSALEAVQQTYPGIDWLRWIIQAARENTRRKSWTPPCPQELLTMCRDSSVRRITGPGDLQAVVMESLERIHKRLQGDTPEVSRLWNDLKGSCTPKDEEALSDYLKSELTKDLHQRGVSTSREVVIRPTAPSTTGQRVDLQVTASTTDEHGEPSGTASVIVEVKGSWNSGLDEAMETQLVQRYMAESQCQHGIYVVGWYDSVKWDTRDKSRKRQSQRRDKEKTSTALLEQAAHLTDGTRVIKSMVLDLSW
jgi:hypothetical protein